jgi:diacylglycerol kinase family enzyme
VKQLEFGEEEAVCGIGGDGTMHELVNGMMNHTVEIRAPLALLRGETGNSFLYGLDCCTTEAVLNRLIDDEIRSIDLFEITVEGKKP